MTKLEVAKVELIRKVKAQKDLAIIRHLDNALAFRDEEWWETLPTVVQESLERSRSQVVRGEVSTDKAVRKRIREWASR